MPAIKYKKKTYAGSTFPVLEMTKAQYDALPDSKKMDGTVYLITDDTGGWEAENSIYDNTTSGMTATNVQDALDELNSNINAICIRERKATTATFNNANYGVAEVDVSKSGYTPLGVVGFQAGTNSVLYRASAVSFKNSTTISMTVVNQSGAVETSTQTGWIDVLYRKNLT